MCNQWEKNRWETITQIAYCGISSTFDLITLCVNPGSDNAVWGKTCVITVSVPENVYLMSSVSKACLHGMSTTTFLKQYMLQLIGFWAHSLFEICCDIRYYRLLPSVNGVVKVMFLVMHVCPSVCLSTEGYLRYRVLSPLPVQDPVPYIFNFVQVGNHCTLILPPRPDMLKLVHYVACTVRQVLS